MIDTVANTKTSYVYDATGQAYATNNEQVYLSLERDGYCRVSKTVEEFEDYKITNHRDFKNTNSEEIVEERVAAEKNGVASIITTTYTTDTLGRPTKTRVTRGGNGIEYDYYYMARSYSPPDAGGTTQYLSYIKEHTITNNEIVYTDPTVYVNYDFVGNITRYGSTYYQYDQLGRLVRENNNAIDKTIIWSYDVGGNITSRTEYAYTEATIAGTAASALKNILL